MNDAETRDDRETKKKKEPSKYVDKRNAIRTILRNNDRKIELDCKSCEKKDHSTLKTVEDGRRRKKASETFFFETDNRTINYNLVKPIEALEDQEKYRKTQSN